MNYGSPGRLISVGDQYIHPAPRPQPYQKRTITKHAPDFALTVSGLAVPYDIPLNDSMGGLEMFTVRTRWELPSEDVVLKANHTVPLGTCTIEEAPSGLHVMSGWVASPMRHYAVDKKQFSIGFTSLDARRRPDGVREHTACILFEISLVARAAHGPHTPAIVTGPPFWASKYQNA